MDIDYDHHWSGSPTGICASSRHGREKDDVTAELDTGADVRGPRPIRFAKYPTASGRR